MRKKSKVKETNFIDNILLKVKRTYTDNELLNLAMDTLKETQIELGKYKAYTSELEDKLKDRRTLTEAEYAHLNLALRKRKIKCEVLGAEVKILTKQNLLLESKIHELLFNKSIQHESN